MKKRSTLLIFFFLSQIVFSQKQTPDTSLIKIVLKDGSSLIGTIIEEDSTSLLFLTKGNIKLTIPYVQIRWKTSATNNLQESKSDSSIQLSDPNTNRLFILPTGRPIGNGRGFFSVSEVFFFSLGMGVGNYTSIVGGSTLLPGSSEQFFFLS